MREEQEELCPICKREMEDTRHVGVECFYEVHEFVPTAKKSDFYVEVPEKTSIWGTTRRYPAGTKDSFRSISEPSTFHEGIEIKHSKIEIDQVPIDPIRLSERHIYSVTCCKACRADFLSMFRDWSEGKLASNDGEGNIPIRVGGSIKYVTASEYEAYRDGSTYSDIERLREQARKDRTNGN